MCPWDLNSLMRLHVSMGLHVSIGPNISYGTVCVHETACVHGTLCPLRDCMYQWVFVSMELHLSMGWYFIILMRLHVSM